MSNLSEPPALARASTRRSRRVSIIWVIPLVAVAIGAYLAWDTLSKEGPTIKISFDSGEGLQAGQSQLKFKDIVFGTVKSLELAPDNTRVVVTVATTHEAKPLLEFVGHEDPPILQANVPGHAFLLKATRLGSISLGSPVFYRDLDVGQVLGWDIADMAEYVTIRAFVRAP